MNKLFTLLTSMGIGAGLMYFYDPERGDRRRALMRDQVTSMKNDADQAIDKSMRDLRNRTRGIMAEAMGKLSDQGAPDWILEERVRAEIGRIAHAGGVEVRADGGWIILNGPALASEEQEIVSSTSRVPGVKGVENRLQIHQSPENIPALQGREELGNPEIWSPSTRLLASLGGGLLAIYGAMRRGLLGTALTATGLGMVARGVTNMQLKELIGISRERRAIRVQKAINIHAPVEEIFRFWTNFENFPRFMANVKEVRDLGNNRSHWVVEGPAGTTVEWDAIKTREIPNEEIVWESVAGSEVESAGKVQFRRNPDDSTRVSVLMGYNPPAGAIGHAVATLMGANPRQQMHEDLNRLKSLFETGKTTVDDREVTGQDMAGATGFAS